jgi:hypothetical protein
MSDFEDQHPRAAVGTFSTKEQSAPETRLTTPKKSQLKKKPRSTRMSKFRLGEIQGAERAARALSIEREASATRDYLVAQVEDHFPDGVEFRMGFNDDPASDPLELFAVVDRDGRPVWDVEDEDANAPSAFLAAVADEVRNCGSLVPRGDLRMDSGYVGLRL